MPITAYNREAGTELASGKGFAGEVNLKDVIAKLQDDAKQVGISQDTERPSERKSETATKPTVRRIKRKKRQIYVPDNPG